MGLPVFGEIWGVASRSAGKSFLLLFFKKEALGFGS
jgi:hypothetical protein